MMEIARNCQNPTTSAEVHDPYQRPTQDPDPAAGSKPALNPDQEMQWSLAKEDCAFSDPALNRQLFLAPPPGQGPDPPSRSLPLDARNSLPGEEASFQEPPGAESGCERLPGVFKEPERQPCEEGPGGRPPPAIVVEPSEGGDVESGELQWPPEDFLSLEEAERERLLAEEEEEAALEAGLSSFESDVEELCL